MDKKGKYYQSEQKRREKHCWHKKHSKNLQSERKKIPKMIDAMEKIFSEWKRRRN